MTRTVRLVPLALGLALAAAAPGAASDPVAGVAGLFGAGLGMTRPAVRARVPAGCAPAPGGRADQLFAECATGSLSAGFTAAGGAWWITASVDLTGTSYRRDAVPLDSHNDMDLLNIGW